MRRFGTLKNEAGILVLLAACTGTASQSSAPRSLSASSNDDAASSSSDDASSGGVALGTPGSVGGRVQGYRGFGLVLQNNGSNDLAIAADGSFAFPPQPSDTPYEVSVKTSPYAPIQACQVQGGSGVSSGAAITDITVVCTADALLAEYRFDEGSGTTALDSSGFAKHGTHNASYLANGKRGGALSTNGGAAGVTVIDSPSWGANNADYTVEYWMFLFGTHPTLFMSIFHKSDSSGSSSSRAPAQWFVPNGTAMHPAIRTITLPNFVINTSPWPINTWMHFALVKVGNQRIIYRDGAAISTETLPSASDGFIGKLFIGKHPSFPGLNGYMDEVRVYGRALTQQEIQRDMQ